MRMHSPSLAISPLKHSIRRYATERLLNDIPAPFSAFHRPSKLRQREAAATDKINSRKTDYIREAVAESLSDRIADVKRNFPLSAFMGSGAGLTIKQVVEDNLTSQIGHEQMIWADESRAVLERDQDQEDFADLKGS